MKLKLIKPRNAIKQLLKLRPEREAMDNFKANLNHLLDNIDEGRSEENQKNHVRDFLLNTYYKGKNEVNTKERADLVIHSGKNGDTPVSVLIETKRPTNKSEMISEGKLNVKALHEIVLYFLRERLDKKNLEVKYAIITNINEWYIIDAKHLQHAFADNKELVKQYDKWRLGQTTTSNNDVFYKEILAPAIDKSNAEIEAVYFNINDYKKELKDADKENDRKLLALYKLLSPYYLLREPFANDSNSLNNNFYKELLHIIGVEERKEKGKVIIDRLEKGKRNYGSLLENTLTRLEKEDPLRRVDNLSLYGENSKEQYYNIALELCLTWVNRVLFLKLLEGQLLSFHHGDHAYRFLHKGFIRNYDDLYELFHDVLAIHYDDREDSITEKYQHIPYLNSSLFDISPLETQALKVNDLKMSTTMPVYGSTVLKDGLKKKEEPDTLEYLFRFLDAYDFTSVDKEDIQEDKRSLINASVLGKIFEKINGYKDGSIFTPGFITMYMSREALRRAVVQKFNEHHNWTCETFDDLYNHIDNKNAKGIKLANGVINSLKVCDPAVGSGHFLVSVMNELIAIKSELEILADEEGKKLKGYSVTVVDDELVITDDEGIPFAYNPSSAESQRVQKTLFHEKQTIIENCLFGVDINPNSVKICRLRLWIELLKNAYYKEKEKLETLPNIDINIKNGNSLISRFALDEDINATIKINEYQSIVESYKNEKNRKETKRLWDAIIQTKKTIQTHIGRENKKQKDLDNLKREYFNKYKASNLFENTVTAEQLRDKKALSEKINKKQNEIDSIKNNVIYKYSFEWRYEFPEVLDSNGNFLGFDVVIGNPPYIKEYENRDAFNGLRSLECYQGKMDIWYLFGCLALRLLRPNGHLCFIATNNWVTNAGASKFRNHVLDNTQILQLVDFGAYMIFDKASIQTMVMLFKKKSDIDDYRFEYRKALINKPRYLDILLLLDDKNESSKTIYPHINKESYRDKFLVFSLDSAYDTIFSKLVEHKNFTLNSTNEIAQGIVPNPDVVNSRNIHKIPTTKITTHNIQVGDGVFVVNKNHFNSIESKKYLKPLYEPYEVSKYHSVSNSKEIIYINKNSYKNDAPELEEHLEIYREIMEARRENMQGKLTFIHLHWPRDEYFFEKGPKLLCMRKCITPTFYYTEKTAFVMMAFNVIKTERINLKYLSGLLNSSLIKFWLNHKGKMQGDIFQVDKEPILDIPIYKPVDEKQQPIIQLVDKILETKEQNSEADTSLWEAEIDKLVYELYGLTEDEIKIVGGGLK